ncbi:phosphotransferase family protein [Deinococcus petrolearius]|uniref:Phosphotransferase family protein n=1 Tax=Deinococcus petrolearius TaxID=1751295 RepID=A0ABW1DHZ7_9DEIO
MPARDLLTFGRSLLEGEGPAVSSRHWPQGLRAAFPGPRTRVEAWRGEGASFARYATPHGPLFLKYVGRGQGSRRVFRRFAREVAYLRDLAPLVAVPHAPLRHAALDGSGGRAHLVTPDLAGETHGWGLFTTPEAQETALLDVARLLARFHAAWAGHPALRGEWRWNAAALLEDAARLAATWSGPHAAAVREAGVQLPGLLAHTRPHTLAHGDIHSGQVLWPQDGGAPVLIDYGQVHPSFPGEDLAHLLAVRLGVGERARCAGAVRAAYREELAAHGLRLSAADLAAEERAGVALNLLSTADQAGRARRGSGVWASLESVAGAWEHGA